MNQMPPSNEETETSEWFETRLRDQGHGFHFAVMRLAETLANVSRRSSWQLVGAEIPVVARNATTHIDFILKHEEERTGYQLITLLIAECKRVNNDYSRWAFVRRPYRGKNHIVFEEFVCLQPTDHTNQTISLRTLSSPTDFEVYGLGLEIKSEKNKEPGKSPINDTVTQVLRGVNGFINHQLAKPSRMDGSTSVVRFLPVIFTTANLWVSDADLANADLASGHLEIAKCQKADWIWFNYNRSPMLSHDFCGEQTSSNRRDLEFEFSRSVAIVSVPGIEQFLTTNLDLLIAR